MSDNFQVKDANGTTITLASAESGGVHTPKVSLTAAIPAGTNFIGYVDINPQATLARAAINAASSGDNQLVAAASGLKTKVLGLFLVAASSVNVKLKRGSTDLTGAMALIVGVPLILPLAMPQYPWHETGTNEALVLNLSGAVQVSGGLVFYQAA